MKTLDSVEETALVTLRSRAIETREKNPLILDPMGVDCLDKIYALMPEDTRNRILNSKIPSSLTIHIALRARKYDQYAKAFLQKHPDGLIVSLGCGFDTRYWRIGAKQHQYIEIDLPEVIETKKAVLARKADYTMLSYSVLDPAWITCIAGIQKEKVLFIAEGLFMYLHTKDVIEVFRNLDATFSKSEIVAEVVNEKYTKGFWKKVVEKKMKRRIKCDAGSSYNFGVKTARDIEAYGEKIKVVEEWSYLEEEDVHPAILKLFRKSKMFTRSQWTIRAVIG